MPIDVTSRLLLSLAAFVFFLAACGSSEEPAVSDTGSPTSEEGQPSGDGGEPEGTLTGRASAILAVLDDGYRRAVEVWPGFDPMDHPTVITLKEDDGSLRGALAINHGGVDALGEATELDTSDLVFDSAHLITEPSDPERLAGIDPFTFSSDLGGIDSFGIAAVKGDEIVEDTTEFALYVLHEMFHRYQIKEFGGPPPAPVESYPFTAENLRLALLEDRALIAGLDAADHETRLAAARHYGAIRLIRMREHPEVSEDDYQERIEGTARFVEHEIGGDDESYRWTQTNFDNDLGNTQFSSVKDMFGAGRFYGSGAAATELLQRLDVADFRERIQAGESPAEVLADELGVNEQNASVLTADAKQAYDADGELSVLAERLEVQADDEPDVLIPSSLALDDEARQCLADNFEIDTDAGEFSPTQEMIETCLLDGESSGVGGAEELNLSDEQLQCLEDKGITLTEGAELDQDAVMACLGES